MHDTHPYTMFSGAGEDPAAGGRRLVVSVVLVAAVFVAGPAAVDVVTGLAGL
ncbi:hypothetical protein [Cellulomonas cellasea]|uniref:Uncharacterized protein n=2 Tax=Cellulomonas cellasea TaxID=43670 RepID=A0A0A0B5Q5_9CELL|nr:hypothetical protein [Cellulomonas cellasea]KGM02185.1 hypothetical protein Q760_14985 [Cellulomonas cellasea DSM 20118]